MAVKKIKEEYGRLPEPVKASLWYIVSSVLLKGISFFTLPLFTRLLTAEQYGMVSVYQSWTGIFTIVTTLSLWGGILNVGMVKFADRKDEMASSFQGLGISITLIYFGISLLMLRQMSRMLGLPELMVIFMYADILAQIPFNIWATCQRYRYKYKKLAAVTAAVMVLNPVTGYFAVTSTQHKAEARIISSSVIQLFIGVFFFAVNQAKGKRFFNREMWSYAFWSGVVLIPHYLSMQVLNQSDRIMIKNICGDGEAGIYSVAYNFAMLLGLMTGGISSSLTPYIYQSLETGSVRNLQKRTAEAVFIAALAAAAIICTVPDLFLILLPESYSEALCVIPPVTMGAFFMFLYPLFSAVEMYYGETRCIAIASVTAAFANVLLNYVFIRQFGFIAAAYTTFACYLILSAVHYFFMARIQKRHGSSIKIYDMKAILLICTGTVLSGFVMLAVYGYPLIRRGMLAFMIFIGFIKRKKVKQILGSVLKARK